ncbi:phosphotransferase enzyme family protein [Paenibacillus harenae]|uniref:phosphotransferase enzyme family protein n=1 Tax=Paenibacillus harenae TaxID=306543 RepID=UPI002794A5CC|nr:phosphotransferase [Paenibacillus harenae]MDQ0061379.1 Ser/Thr protein kinase RdoA (MazF antagonist) [Paenibacillus harenae]
MNTGFRIDTETNRCQTLKQTKQAALIALQEYEVDWSSIHFIQVSEHVTFRIVTDEGEQFLLRIHPPGKPREETISELEWLSEMKSKGLILPAAVPNRQGAFVTDAATSDGLRFYSTLLRWIEGERLEKGALTEEAIRKMGAMMANLHEASTDFSPSSGFARPSWGSQSFDRDWAHLSLHHRHFISEEAFELYSKAANKAADRLGTFTSHERNYGMIHADLHIGNVVFRDDEPYPIDFGRCGFGYHLYDIAQSIMGLLPSQRAYFIEGYERIRQLDDEAIPKLECFFIVAIIEAYSFHAENPLETEGLIEEQPYAQAILKAYVDGAPFLFQPLEVS